MSTTKRTVIGIDEELVVKGRLIVEGNVTQLEQTNVTTVTNLAGNTFTINSDSSNTTAILALNSNGTTATVAFSDTSNSIVVNKPIIFTSGNVTAPIFVGNVTGNVTGFVSNITNHTTTNLAEGTNLYFTAARARGNVSAVKASGFGNLTYSSANGVFTFTGVSTSEIRTQLSANTGVAYNSSTGNFTLDSTTGGAGLTYTSGVLAVGAGSGITVNADNVTVDSTVIRTSGTQTITGNTTFVGTTSINGNIVPTSANTGFIGTPALHIGEIWANLVHVERLDLGDANIADIHERFFAGNVTAPYLTTNTAGGLVYTHNATSAGYQVNAGDGLQLVSNTVAVNSTVVRTVGNQTITGNTTLVGNLSITGNLDVTANINSLTVVDLLVQDANIVLRSNATSDGNARIIVERGNVADTYILWDGQADAWKFTNNGTTEFLIPTSTTDLNEGNNLYFTTGRVNTAIDAYIIGGAGLTYTSGTIAIGAGTGITVNADNVSVDSSVVRTTSNQSIAGVKTFTGELVIPSITSATANNSIYVNPSSNSCFVVINGNPIQLTADSDVGQVEDVGSTGINIYAGFRSQPVDNVDIIYHGIKSINAGTLLTISEASNVITISGNTSAIRGSLSTANVSGYGGISYNNATGVFSYVGVSDAQIRTLISSTGLIAYNNSTGVISTTADNYGSWSVQTDTGVGSRANVISGNTVIVQGGTGITVTNSGTTLTIASTNTADITGVTAGNGLSGGGTAGDVTLNVGGGYGITVNADTIEVNNANIRALFSASSPLSYNVSTGAFSITEVGDISSVVAGSGLSGGGTSGDVTLNIGAGYGITVNADTIEVSNANIRALFSATGPLSYNVSTGAFSITETGDVSSVVAGNGLVDGGTTGDVTLNIGAGAGITVNADNIALTSGIVTAGTYGNATTVPAVTVDTFGRVTGVSNTSISITSSQVSNFVSAANSAIDSRIVGGSGLTYSSGTLAVGAGSFILVGTDDISVDATSANTASKVVARDVNGSFAANVITATATSARYADLAENYLADSQYEPGTVLVFGGSEEVTASIQPESTRVAGVVTTAPAHVMNSMLQGEHVVCIALRGRVPVKVKGTVMKGDVLVSCGEGHVGYAVASLNPRSVPAAAIVGKAITDKTDPGLGVVEALI